MDHRECGVLFREHGGHDNFRVSAAKVLTELFRYTVRLMESRQARPHENPVGFAQILDEASLIWARFAGQEGQINPSGFMDYLRAHQPDAYNVWMDHRD